jgi:hypothetical protein
MKRKVISIYNVEISGCRIGTQAGNFEIDKNERKLATK